MRVSEDTESRTMIKMAYVKHRVPGMVPFLEEKRKLMWVRETRVRLFKQMELQACRDGCRWLLKCDYCVVNIFPEERYPSMHLLIFPDYAKNLTRRWEMSKGHISTYC